jgi:competence protein ComEA
VGPSKAEEIVRYREAFGPFETVDELAEVKGIGKSTLEKNRDLITLE